MASIIIIDKTKRYEYNIIPALAELVVGFVKFFGKNTVRINLFLDFEKDYSFYALVKVINYVRKNPNLLDKIIREGQG